MIELTCVICPRGCRVKVSDDFSETTGNKCPRGHVYAVQEAKEPKRILTSTVKIEGSELIRLPVRSDNSINKELMLKAMDIIRVHSFKGPVKAGDIVIPNILGTEVNIIASTDA
ncbi:MAG: DUF1667 domain-containing protein [Clostridiaceae bacterium]